MKNRMLRPIDTSRGPRGGFWVWKCPETGHLVRHGNFPGIRKEVKDYMRANNFPITVNFDDELISNICANAQPGVCEEYDPPSFIEKVGRLSYALGNWAKSGFKVRTAEQVEGIQKICKGCSYYGGENGFLKVICSKCGCSRKKLWLATEHCPLPEPKW